MLDERDLQVIQQSPKHREKQTGTSIPENALLHAFPLMRRTESIARTWQTEESWKAVHWWGFPSTDKLLGIPCSKQLGGNLRVPPSHGSSNKKNWLLSTSRFPLTSVWTARLRTLSSDKAKKKLINAYITLLVRAYRRERMEVCMRWQNCHPSLPGFTLQSTLHPLLFKCPKLKAYSYISFPFSFQFCV